MKKKLIMIPYAELEGSNTSTNMLDCNDRVAVYMKNCVVACLSAKQNAGEDVDVALVTNNPIGEPYKSLLLEKGVLLINVPFDMFNFGGSYTWCLAFYKLCAFYHICREMQYDYYAYLDADVYVQHPFENVWEEAEKRIMLFDLGHGLHIPQYQNLAKEMAEFLGEEIYATQYGGEFVAVNKDDALLLSEKCYEIYKQMEERAFVTKQGDEFILTIAANGLREKVKSAGAYVFRFHTGTFRIAPARYKFNPVSVLHVPNEKKYGFLAIYDYYLRHKQLPANEKVWKALHLTKKSAKTKREELLSPIKKWIKKLLKKS